MNRPPPSELATRYRTHTCGELLPAHVYKPQPGPAQPIPVHDDLDIVLPRRPSKTGPETVTLCGHVDTRIDAATVLLRDRYGKTRVQADPGALPYVPDRFGKLSPEDVVQVSGVVIDEPPAPRGVALSVKKIEVLSRAAAFPARLFTAPELAAEEKLRFRQLYLRRAEVQERLAFRSRLAHALREFLLEDEFLEIETPHLFWYDPVAIGGEVIPHGKGRAWRLPSGPVVLNQYIKGGQFDRFFQFLRITRRENSPGPQHQQEHTGLDVNLSYADVPDFQAMTERMLAHAARAVGKELATPFPSYSYEEAMLKFGTDKPDLRFDLSIVELPDKLGRAFRAFGASGSLRDADLAGLSFARVAEKKIEGPAAAVFRDNPRALLAVKGAPGDILVHSKAKDSVALGEQRVALAQKLGLAGESKLAPCWIHSYPFLEDDKGTLVARVVVFSTPVDGDGPKVGNPAERANVRARAFDLIVNGVEVASGYVGNHNLAAQRMIWSQIFKIANEDIFRLRAPIESHRFGVPPHGGINFGFDRLVAILAGAKSIDEVMAFPKTADCRDLLLDAPAGVPPAAVADLVEEHPAPAGGIAELSQETANL